METSSKKTIPGRNGGTLRNGGPNKGGPGRPRSVIKEACADLFDERGLEIARQILDSEDSTNADKLRTLDLLGKYGGLQSQQVELSQERLTVEEAAQRIYQAFQQSSHLPLM